MMLHDAIAHSFPDYLDHYSQWIDRDAILALRQERLPRLLDPRMQRFVDTVRSLQDLRTECIDLSGDVVKLGRAEDLSSQQQQQLLQALQIFCPWKKGPFEIFGVAIDAEWRSDWKWSRIVPHIQPLCDRKVADIGCHNGYFMFRMAHQNPACVIGFEPITKLFWNFQLLQNIAQQKQLAFETMGVEHIHHYPKFFDTIFCLGILYHHADPIGLLHKMHDALAPQGELIIDCQGIPGEMPIALTPNKRYAQARSIWFLPTQSCLENWLVRAGFSHVHCFFAAPLSTQEQRRTQWANIDSLKEFLDPKNLSLTCEGYPAPWRYYLTAQKK